MFIAEPPNLIKGNDFIKQQHAVFDQDLYFTQDNAGPWTTTYLLGVHHCHWLANCVHCAVKQRKVKLGTKLNDHRVVSIVSCCPKFTHVNTNGINEASRTSIESHNAAVGRRGNAERCPSILVAPWAQGSGAGDKF